MRVLFLTHSYPRWMGDAAGSFLLRLAQALREHGVEVAVHAPSAPGLPPSDTIGGVPVTRFRYAPRSWETLAYTGTMAEEARGSWRGRAALAGLLAAGTTSALRREREFSPDVIHAHWWFPGGVQAAAVKALTGRPLVLTMHGSDVRFAQSIPAARPAFRWVTGAAAVVTTVSGWLARRAEAVAPGLRPIVAPMPAAMESFTPNESERSSTRVLFVGRLNEQKGILRLVDAVARMSIPVDVDVVGDGPQGDLARERAAERGVAARFHWHGAIPQHELPPLYRRAAVFALPALDEGLGLATVEAQLCGTPVVAFDSGGIPDTLNSGVTGRLVPAGDVDAFARTLEELVADPALMRTMGAAGRAWAIERFSPASVAARYADLYRVAISA